MKSQLLIGLVFGLSVACTSTEADQEKAPLIPASKESVEAATAPDKDQPVSQDDKAAPAAAPVEAAAVETPADAAPAPVETAAAEAQPAVSNAQVVYPTTSLLNLRQGPGIGNAVARKVRFGEAISLSGEAKGKWLKTTDGLWVNKSFTSSSKPSQSSDPAAPVAAASSPVSSEAAPTAQPEAPAAQ